MDKNVIEIDPAEQIRAFEAIIESAYLTALLDAQRSGINRLVIDFTDVAKQDLDLANALLEQPEEAIKTAELAAERFINESLKGKFKIRFKNLPKNQDLKIRNVRSSHIGKFFMFTGVVRQKSDVRPQVTTARFECPSCGNIISLLQLDTKFREPSRCNCGRKGHFFLIGKELIDAQGIVLEESSEELDGGEQPKRMNVLLKDDLVSPMTEKHTNPGTKVLVVGTVKEIPVPSKDGGKLTRYDLLIEANYVESVHEDYTEIHIEKEDEDKILEIARDPKGYQRLIKSLAPSIYGYEKIKEALLLQLAGGVRKIRTDGSIARGDMHVLLIGDPGCIAGDSQVSLIYKGMEQIKNLGETHLQPIKEYVTKIRKNGKDKYYDVATKFHHYPKQRVLRLVTETGKEVVCTYNQPFLTKEGWKRADEIPLRTEIRVMPRIPSMVKKHAQTSFIKIEKKSGPLKEITIPEFVTPELASLYGYVIGDGNIHPNGYRVTCYVNEEETDLLPMLSKLWFRTFHVQPSIITRTPVPKTIDDGSGLLREIQSTQQMHLLEINSRQVAQCLSILANKRVPQQIFRSPKNVIAKFISWLFEADGCAFGYGRGRTAIQLKSTTAGLLKDVQLLLLHFGIQSRVNDENLCIRRSYDMELFAKEIGFNSEKKKNALSQVLAAINVKNEQQKRKIQSYEKVIKIEPAGVIDVYDFEVPRSHSFVANGIVCHNSGKSQLLKRITQIAPKGRYVAGKGSSAAGLTASVVKDEFLGGWALEAGAMVLANHGFLMIDEMDKMTKEDTSALHEGLEQQQVSIAKANIQATLRCETTVLAAANPKFGRFDPHEILAKQIDMPPALINRFDLIFPIKDLPDQTKDERLAHHVLTLHQHPDVEEPEVPTALLKKYISYVRQRMHPKLSDEAIEEIKKFYVQLRNQGQSDEGGIKSVAISARQLEALVRMAEASAKIHLREVVTIEDAKRGIDLLYYCLTQVGLDPETGKIDIDRIATGIGATQRSSIAQVREIINDLEAKVGKTIPIDDIINEARERGMSESVVEEAIERLKRTGDLFEPKQGWISKL